MNRIIHLIIILSMSLRCLSQGRYAVVINELMADPSPAVGLPANEWIELLNRSNDTIQLQGWRIGSLQTRSGPLPVFILAPDSMLIVCNAAALEAMQSYGNAVAVTGFPSLDNDAGQISLYTRSGMAMHALAYASDWYDNDLKKQGGWSLEMIDANYPCAGKLNWRASTDALGGSPGRSNDVADQISEPPKPTIGNVFMQDSSQIVLVADMSLDSAVMSALSHYRIEPQLSITEAVCMAPLFNKIMLTCDHPPDSGIIYTIHIDNLTGCSLQEVDGEVILRFGTPAIPRAMDMVINEILFNPAPGDEDYIELYNNSKGIIDAGRLSVAGRDASGSLSSIYSLSEEPYYIYPGEYILLSKDLEALMRNHFVPPNARLLKLSTLPSCPDDHGDIVLLDEQGDVIDELNYNEDWQFPLLDNKEGVALERIDATQPTNKKENWHSASASSGYGTPARKNSQLREGGNSVSTFQLRSASFSPDNDGYEDLCLIDYNLDDPSYLASVSIFDANGVLVRQLIRNEIAGSIGSWTWDGLDDRKKRLLPGYYIIVAELFNLRGKKKFWKEAVAMAVK